MRSFFQARRFGTPGCTISHAIYYSMFFGVGSTQQHKKRMLQNEFLAFCSILLKNACGSSDPQALFDFMVRQHYFEMAMPLMEKYQHHHYGNGRSNQAARQNITRVMYKKIQPRVSNCGSEKKDKHSQMGKCAGYNKGGGKRRHRMPGREGIIHWTGNQKRDFRCNMARTRSCHQRL